MRRGKPFNSSTNKRPLTTRLRLEQLETRRMLTIAISGNGNTDAASLAAAGGPGNPGQAGFVNVGLSPTRGASVTYLGNGWIITANHVSVSATVNTVVLGGVTYTIDNPTTGVSLTNVDNSTADLKLYHLSTIPNLPSLVSLLDPASPSGRVIMIGNGVDIGSQHFWSVDKSGATWQWTDGAEPANPGPNDYSGFDVAGSHVVRWGENTVASSGFFVDDGAGISAAFTTTFDNLDYTGTPSLASEAQAVNGDSGGAVFSLVGGVWELSGIMLATSNPLNNQPASTALFGDTTYIADLSPYRSQILATINPAPVIALTAGAGSGAPNFTTSWYDNGPVPIANNILAAITTPSAIPTLQSLTVTLATFHTGDVLTVPILTGVSITSSYSAGTLTLSGTDTLAHYQQELRYISYNNTVDGPGVSSTLATFVANDGTLTSTPVTATININVATGQVLGNRLFYNNSKYDGGAGSGNAAINANDDLAIASDKTAYKGTGLATFANVSAFTKGITGIMVDLQSGLGNHAAINLTSGDITFKVSPNTFVTTTYNQLSTWTAAPTPTAISVRMGAGVGGSDRLEITWATGAIKNMWLEVNVHSGGNTGLSANDVFYFGSLVGNSGTGDTTSLSKTDVSDYVAANNNIIGLTTPIWNLVDYTKDGKVDITDSNSAINGVFTLHYIGNAVGPFAPDSGGGSAAPAATLASSAATTASSAGASPPANLGGAVTSGLSILSGGSSSWPAGLGGRAQSVFFSPPVSQAIQTALHDPHVLHAVDQVAEKFQSRDDALESLLAELELE